MVLSLLFPEKKSPIDGVPVIPGGTLYGGHLHLLREPDFRKALYQWSVQHADEYGRATFWMGPTTPSLSVSHWEDVQSLLHASATRDVFPLMKLHAQQLFGENNVATLNGKEWKQQRARIAKALHASAVTTHHQEAFGKAAEQLVQHVTKLAQQNANKDQAWECPDVLELMKGLTLDCFGLAAFGADFGTCRQLLFQNEKNDEDDDDENDASRIGAAFDTLTSEMMRRTTKDLMNPASHVYSIPTAANQQFANAKKTVLDFLTRLIEKRQEQILIMSQQLRDHNVLSSGGGGGDLLTRFLEMYQRQIGNDEINDEKASSYRNQSELAHVISQSTMGLLFAGYETSSVSLTYCLIMLSQHSRVLDQCLDEINRVNDDTPHPSNVVSTSTRTSPYVYLEAVIKETLRLYPPAISTTRSADRDLELRRTQQSHDKTILVPKGTYLYFPIWIIHRDPQHFVDPLEFRPERWVSQDSATGEWHEKPDDDTHRSKAWIPFSAGARACPGQHFAMREMITILTILLPALSFGLPEGYELTPHRDGFVQMPKGGVPMTFKIRS